MQRECNVNCFIDTTTGQLSSECLELVLETMAEGVIFIDTNYVIQYANMRAQEMTGLNKDALCGLISDDVLLRPSRLDGDVFKEGAVHEIECSLVTAKGNQIPVSCNGRVVVVAGNVIGAVETFRDITPLRLQENKIVLLEEQLERLDGIPDIIAKSHAMAVVFEQIGFASKSQANTYIYGESGTGKELTARAIHDMSSRSKSPFVAVNCSALPDSLLESELFGHVRGAFTGAIRDKKGRFELAEGGTLFLDEIGDVSPLIQVKLLRFLQERTFERVGDSVTQRVDVRIITATNQDLKQLVQEGLFREDLYYRLNVFPIVLPPLRDRMQDIPVLIKHFLTKYSKSTGKKISEINSEALLLMMNYEWPGNVRELENAIEHAFVTCQDKEITPLHLPKDIRPQDMLLQPVGPVRTGPSKRKKLTKEELSLLLDKFDNNMTDAARYLGIDRTTLWRWVKKHKLDRP